MADIEFRTMTVVYVTEDEAWCQYVMKNFNRPELQLNVHQLNVKALGPGRNPPELETAVRESYVTMLLTTSHLLEYMEENCDWLPAMLTKGERDVTTVVTALLHVSEEELQDVITKSEYESDSWKQIVIDVSGINIKQCVSEVLGIVDTNSGAKKSMSMRVRERRQSDSAMIYRGQETRVELVPSTVYGPGEKVAILFKEEMKGNVTVIITGAKSKSLEADRVNPYCVTFVTPEVTGKKSHVRVQINVDGIRECRLQLEYKSLAPQFNSVELMCQSYGVSSKEELDKKLAERFNTSICTDGRAMMVFDEVTDTFTSDSQFPTMVHWAAANGLSELCSALLSAPGAEAACRIDNRYGRDPADIARESGYSELSDVLMDFIETKEMAEACDLYVRTEQLKPPTKQGASGGDDLYEDMTGAEFGAMGISSINKPPSLPPRTSVSPTSKTASRDTDTYVMPESILPEGAIGSRSQAELVEIQEQVKIGNFSVEEAERFLNSWKLRYETGNAISFKERQQGLKMLQSDNKKAMETLKSTGVGKKKAKTKDIKEGLESLNISDPIHMRNKMLGSFRDPPLTERGSNTSLSSSSSTGSMVRISQDSGRDSTTSNISVTGGSSIATLEEEEEHETRDVVTRSSSSQSLRSQNRKTRVYEHGKVRRVMSDRNVQYLNPVTLDDKDGIYSDANKF